MVCLKKLGIDIDTVVSVEHDPVAKAVFRHNNDSMTPYLPPHPPDPRHFLQHYLLPSSCYGFYSYIRHLSRFVS